MSRDQHQLIHHYADGVADVLGLSTPQQIAIRTALALALREQAAGYEATQADLCIKLHNLTEELTETWRASEAPVDATLSSLLANVKASGGSAPSTISTNGTHPAAVTLPAAEPEIVEVGERPDPTTPAPAPQDRKPAEFKWPTLDDTTLGIVRDLDEGRTAWRTVDPQDKRIIVLATIAELQDGMSPGQTLGILEFERRRPIWMASFASISQSLGRTWKQLQHAATQV